MRALRFGSYSICATFAGTPSLFRRKSINRYRRFVPTPWRRAVMRPWLLRPACLRPFATSFFSGFERVISSNEDTLAPRRPGVVGLYLRTATIASLRLEDLDGIALGERDDRPLLVGLLAGDEPALLDLAAPDQCVHVHDLDVPYLLDRLFDLGLVRVGMHEEGVAVLLEPRVGLLGDDRPDDDIARALHSAASCFLAAKRCSSP